MAVITTNAPNSSRSLSLEVTIASQNVANNTTTLNWKLYGSGGTTTSWVTSGNFKATINGTQVYFSATRISLYNGTVVASGQHTVTHNADGTKTIALACEAGIYAIAVNAWASGNMTLTTIPRQATITGANNFTDEENPYMTYSNPAGNSATVLAGGIWRTDGATALSGGYANVNKTGTSATFVLTQGQRDNIRSIMSAVNSMTVRYYLNTQIGGSDFRPYVERTLTIVNATPLMNNFSYEDTNNTTKALTGNDQIIIKGKSNLRIFNITATALKYATKKSVIVDSVSANWTDTYEKTINNYNKNNIGIAMVDSRNNTSSTMTKTITFKEYFDITKGQQEIERGGQGIGEEVTINCKGTWWNDTFGQVANAIVGSYRFRKTGASSWVAGTTAITINSTNNNFVINQIIKGDTNAGFDINESYDVEVIVSDKLSTQTFTFTLIAGSPAIAILGNKISLGGKYDENRTSQKIQMNSDVYDKNGQIMKSGSYYLSVNVGNNNDQAINPTANYQSFDLSGYEHITDVLETGVYAVTFSGGIYNTTNAVARGEGNLNCYIRQGTATIQNGDISQHFVTNAVLFAGRNQWSTGSPSTFLINVLTKGTIKCGLSLGNGSNAAAFTLGRRPYRLIICKIA